MIKMISENVNIRNGLHIAFTIWSRSFFVFAAFFIGWLCGLTNAEHRISSDCKFANAFRVEIQAFNCQRKI